MNKGQSFFLAVVLILIVALLIEISGFLREIAHTKRPADPAVVVEVCSTDTDCMLRNGGDGSPAPEVAF